MAYNKVKLPALLTILFGLLNILSIYLLIHYTNLELWAVVLVKFVIVILYNAFFMPLYVSKITRTPKWYFLKIPIIALLSFVSVYSLIYCNTLLVNIESLFEIVSFSVLLLIVMLPLQFFIFFSKDERHFLFGKI